LSDQVEPSAIPGASLPPILRNELLAPRITPLPWYWGIAPACLGIVVWAPFFDQLWASDLRRHSPASLAALAIVALVVCFAIFALAATWGYQTKHPLGIVAASTFGTTGSEWLTGIAVAAGQIVWYAVALNFALDSTFLGLEACGLLATTSLAAIQLGGLYVKSPVYLATALFWIFITRKAISMRLPGVVVALMRIYAPVALLLLTLAGLWNVPSFFGATVSAAPHALVHKARALGIPVARSAVSMILGFFALPCLFGVEWGRAAASRRDIVLGSLPTIVGAGSWTAIMSLVVVTATLNRAGPDAGTSVLSLGEPLPLSFRGAVLDDRGFYPPGVAAAILILFGLAALAPAVASLNVIAEKLSARWPWLGLKGSTWIAAAFALVLMATGCTDYLGPLYTALGAVFAPVLGAMAGDRLRAGSGPHVIRSGVSMAGILAWAAGFLVAALGEFATSANPELAAWLQQTSILGFLVAAVSYGLLARAGMEAPEAKLDDLAPRSIDA
jgi:hypothetical protein